jgi:N-acetyl-anhydromuramyl-L-alanine amidase AmpD
MIDCVTPHQSIRPASAVITRIILHCDTSPIERATIEWFKNPKAKASYHVLIGRDGRTYRFVEDTRMAWHAKGNNRDSLGLAFSNRNNGSEQLTAAQIAVAKRVIQNWLRGFPTIRTIVGHKDVDPKRKSDPYGAPNFNLMDFKELLGRYV